MDGLEDYVPFKTHSNGLFVPGFVEAVAVFEEYLVRLAEVEDILNLGETRTGPEEEQHFHQWWRR